MTSLVRRLTGHGPAAPESGAWLVVGLGNPGPRYARTRHNVGYLVCDVLVRRTQGSYRPSRSRRADVVETRLGPPGDGGSRVVLARPRSYMNESGGPVRELLDFYRLGPDRLVVVHDELDLPLGSLRVKHGGGDNGHNGLRSVRSVLGTGDFTRVRIGIGRPPGAQDPAEYVLRPFTPAERSEAELVAERAADAVESLVLRGLELTQSHFN